MSAKRSEDRARNDEQRRRLLRRRQRRPSAPLAVVAAVLLATTAAAGGWWTSAAAPRSAASSFVARADALVASPAPRQSAGLVARRPWSALRRQNPPPPPPRGLRAVRGGAGPDEREAAPLVPPASPLVADDAGSPARARGSSQGEGSAMTAVTTAAAPVMTMRPPLEKYNATSLDAGSTPIPDLFRILDSGPLGLSEGSAKQRLQYYGENVLVSAPSKSLLRLFLEQFEDRLVQILLVIATVSAVFSFFEVQQQHASPVDVSAEAVSLWKFFVEPAVILLILLLNAVVGVWQSASASDSLEALRTLQPALATVVRGESDGDGESHGGGGPQQQQVLAGYPASQLVPGDVIHVRVGDKIPADARLVSSSTGGTLQVDESSLTGESVTVQKLAGEEGTLDRPGLPIQDQSGMLYAGTLVTRGSGVAVVTHTGMASQMGRISQGVTDAAADAPKTPLERKLDEFSSTLTVIIGVICLAVWIISIPKFNDAVFPGGFWEGAVYYAKVAVALGVAAIPEGLPAVITLCLSLGTRRMAERNVIVRKLASVETLGCTSVICTDKTGTLTTNEMTAVSLVLVEHDGAAGDDLDERVREHAVHGISYSPVGEVDGIPYQTEVQLQPLGAIADIAAVCALCNDARVIGNDGGEEKGDGQEATAPGTDEADEIRATASPKKTKPTGKRVYDRVGEPTEAALCVLAEKLGGMSHYLEDSQNYLYDRAGLHLNVPPSVLASANVDVWRERHPRVATLEFSRDRKSMSVLSRFEHADYPTPSEFHVGIQPRRAGNRLLVKGAPNLLMERCTHVKFRDGTVARLSGQLRRALEAKLSEMAARPLRCLALAIKEHDDLEESLKDFDPKSEREIAKHPLLSDPSNYRNIESGLCLLGIVGIKDPARPEVADSIRQCSKAGIRVMMITGDAKDTAVAIARDVNIFSPDDEYVKAFEGREFFEKPQWEQLDVLREGNVVFCRTEPADKQKLVKMLQSLDEIAAMTGDGVNDAPALQQAAIGVAMGVTGTEVSKEAADMILADDNFSTIVNAVEEGRRIYANMQAFICFLISCNIGEICAIFLATLAGFPEPLTAMHLLWVNLVTGSLLDPSYANCAYSSVFFSLVSCLSKYLQVDGPPATALGFNPPAPDLMAQPPRPSDEPIMTRWLLTRYCLTGLYVGVATIGVFVQHYMSQGISLAELASWSQCGQFWSPPGGSGLTCVDLFQGSGRMLPQTLALTTLVCMEMLKALSAVSVDNSIFRVGPQSNPWLIAGVSGPLLLHLFVLYSSKFGLPALGESFGMVPLSMDDWVNVLAWAAPILLVEEILKAIGRWIYREERSQSSTKRHQAPKRLPVK